MFFRNVYAVDDTYEDDDGNIESDEYVVNDTVDNIKAELYSKIEKIKNISMYDEKRYGNNRSYPSKVFATITDDDDSYGVELHCISGYYGGANFDIQLYHDGNTYSTIDDMIEGIEEYDRYWETGKRMWKTRRAVIEKRIVRLIDLVESVYRDYTEKE